MQNTRDTMVGNDTNGVRRRDAAHAAFGRIDGLTNTVGQKSGVCISGRSFRARPITNLGKSRQRYVSRHRIHRSERRWHGQRFFGLQGPNWVDVGLQPCSGRHKARAGFVWSLKESNFWSAHCRPANSRPGKVTYFRGKEIRRSTYKSAIYAKSDVALRTFAGIYPNRENTHG